MITAQHVGLPAVTFWLLNSCVLVGGQRSGTWHMTSARGAKKSFWFPEVDFPNNRCDNGMNSSACLIAGGMLDCLPGSQQSAPMTPPARPDSLIPERCAGPMSTDPNATQTLGVHQPSRHDFPVYQHQQVTGGGLGVGVAVGRKSSFHSPFFVGC